MIGRKHVFIAIILMLMLGCTAFFAILPFAENEASPAAVTIERQMVVPEPPQQQTQKRVERTQRVEQQQRKILNELKELRKQYE